MSGADALTRIAEIRSEAEAAIDSAADTAALEEARVRFLGRKSELTSILRGIGELPADERGPAGAGANEARRALEERIERRSDELEGAPAGGGAQGGRRALGGGAGAPEGGAGGRGPRPPLGGRRRRGAPAGAPAGRGGPPPPPGPDPPRDRGRVHRPRLPGHGGPGG